MRRILLSLGFVLCTFSTVFAQFGPPPGPVVPVAVAPDFSALNITSSNPNTGWAKDGDTLSFELVLQNPSVIGVGSYLEIFFGTGGFINLPYAPSALPAAVYNLSYTVLTGDSGQLNINDVNMIGDGALPIINVPLFPYPVTPSVTVDNEAPTLQSADVVVSGGTPGEVVTGETVTYTFTFAEPVTISVNTPSVAVNLSLAPTTELSGTEVTSADLVFPVVSADGGLVTPTVDFDITDRAGNTTTITSAGTVRGEPIEANPVVVVPPVPAPTVPTPPATVTPTPVAPVTPVVLPPVPSAPATGSGHSGTYSGMLRSDRQVVGDAVTYEESLAFAQKLNEGIPSKTHFYINENGYRVFSGYQQGRLALNDFEHRFENYIVFRGEKKPARQFKEFLIEDLAPQQARLKAQFQTIRDGRSYRERLGDTPNKNRYASLQTLPESERGPLAGYGKKVTTMHTVITKRLHDEVAVNKFAVPPRDTSNVPPSRLERFPSGSRVKMRYRGVSIPLEAIDFN